MHHKVAAKVEHAGVYSQGADPLSFGEIDPNAAGGLLGGTAQLRRTGSSGSLASRGSLGGTVGQNATGANLMNQPQHMRNWLNPINMDSIVRKLNVSTLAVMSENII